jgi:ATP-binding cassette subfamily F protein 3
VDQLQAEVLDPDRTVLSELRTVTDVEPPGRNLRTYLASFGFRGDVVDQRVGELSGGEQTRLALAKALAVPVNLLVLDEPTNHLDLPSCDILEDALTAYPGTVVLITHDRHLIRSVADHLIEVRDGRASWHVGVPEHLLYPVAVQPPIRYDGDGRDTRAKSSRGPKKDEKTSPDRELRRRLTRAERDWEEAEAKLADLQTRLGDPDLYRDPETAASVVAEHGAAKDRAAESMATWEDLDREMRS